VSFTGLVTVVLVTDTDLPGNRCKSELKEARTLLGDSNKLSVLHQAQREIVKLISSAVRASTYPGVYHSLDDLSTVETRLRAIVADVFPPDKRWPEYMEPLPSARQSLSMMYLGQGKAVPALRNALQGTLLTTRKHHRPEWVNEMVNVVTTLIMTGSLPPDTPVFEDETFPTVEEIRSVTYGYLFVLYDTARKVLGTEVEYTKAINEMVVGIISKKQGSQPGSHQFADAFEPAQRKMLAWAKVPEEKGLKVPRPAVGEERTAVMEGGTDVRYVAELGDSLVGL
jgi:SET and MYND domain-containing protein